jgi:2-C-methyl-D-erythritol 4-phosphate cytidylyltransferase
VQTPQCFAQASIRRAYDIPFHPGITDDASLAEEAGFAIHLVDGNEENIKITTQNDLLIAELFLRKLRNHGKK